jgi:hypothetical protein
VSPTTSGCHPIGHIRTGPIGGDTDRLFSAQPHGFDHGRRRCLDARRVRIDPGS